MSSDPVGSDRGWAGVMLVGVLIWCVLVAFLGWPIFPARTASPAALAHDPTWCAVTHEIAERELHDALRREARLTAALDERTPPTDVAHYLVARWAPEDPEARPVREGEIPEASPEVIERPSGTRAVTDTKALEVLVVEPGTGMLAAATFASFTVAIVDHPKATAIRRARSDEDALTIDLYEPKPGDVPLWRWLGGSSDR